MKTIPRIPRTKKPEFSSKLIAVLLVSLFLMKVIPRISHAKNPEHSSRFFIFLLLSLTLTIAVVVGGIAVL